MGIRFNKTEKIAIEEIAKRQYMYPSSWIRKVISEKLEEYKNLETSLEKGTRSGKTLQRVSR